VRTIRKPSDEAIKAQIEGESTALDEARKEISFLRARNKELNAKLRAFYAPEGTKTENQVIKKLTDALYGIHNPTIEQIEFVYKMQGHFLLRFPSGHLIQEQAPDRAKQYLKAPARFRTIPDRWLIVNHRGELSSFDDIKKPFADYIVQPRSR